MISLLVKNNVIKIFNYIIYIYLTKVVKLDFPFPWPSRRAYLFLAEQGQGTASRWQAFTFRIHYC